MGAGHRGVLGLVVLGMALAAAAALVATAHEAAAHRYLELGMPNSLLFALRIRLLRLAPLLVPLPLLVGAGFAVCGIATGWLVGGARDEVFQRVLAASLAATGVAVGLLLLRYATGWLDGIASRALRAGSLLAAGAIAFPILTRLLSRRRPDVAAASLLAVLGSRRGLWALGLPTAVVFGVGLGFAPLRAQELSEGRPPVILLVVDTLRADHVGVYGADPQLTPNLDRLARSAVVFGNTVAQGPNTINSSASILASLYPSEHGYFDYEAVVSSEIATLAERLREVGYRTFGVSTNPHVTGRNGLAQGFETFEQDLSWRDTDAGDVNRAFLDWLEGREERPFFAMLWYIDPHTPYDPPEAVAREVVPQPLRPLVSERTKDPRHELTSDEKHVARLLYRGEVHYFDSELGRLIAELERRQLLDRSLLIVTADHGEAFWEGRDLRGRPLQGHGTSLRRELLDVPLIVHLPGSSTTGRVETRVDSIDILPTVLEVAGVEAGPAEIRGRSLLRVLDGSDRHPRVSFSELISTRLGPYVMRSARGDGAQLVETQRYLGDAFEPPHEELLALRGTAGGEPEASRDRLRSALAEWRAGLLRFEAAGIETADEEHRRLRERLEALGYVE